MFCGWIIQTVVDFTGKSLERHWGVIGGGNAKIKIHLLTIYCCAGGQTFNLLKTFNRKLLNLLWLLKFPLLLCAFLVLPKEEALIILSCFTHHMILHCISLKQYNNCQCCHHHDVFVSIYGVCHFFYTWLTFCWIRVFPIIQLWPRVFKLAACVTDHLIRYSFLCAW